MISPADPITAIRSQRRTESPVFWMIVFAGSLLLHLLLALWMRSRLVQAVRVPVEPEPIAVEFAEATDTVSPPQSAQPKQPPSPAVAAKSAPADPPSDAQPVASPVEPPSTSLPSPTSAATLSTPESTRPVSQPFQSTAPTSSRPRSVAPPVSTPAPTNPVPNQVATESTASSLNNHLSNPAIRGPIASGIRLPDVPSVPNPADNLGQPTKSSNLPINPLAIAKAPTPAKFLAQIQLLPVVDRNAIASSTSDHPITIQGGTSKEFISDASSCLLTPEALSEFGKAVVLSVSLDEQGQLQGEPSVLDQSSSGNSSYDDLAACVLKQWTFSPAHNQVDENTPSSKSTTIHVQVKITE